MSTSPPPALPRRVSGQQYAEAVRPRAGDSINMLVSMNPRVAAMRFSLGGATYTARDFNRIHAQQGAVGLEELFERHGVSTAAVVEYLDDVANDARAATSTTLSLTSVELQRAYQMLDHTDLRGTRRTPLRSAATIAEASLTGISARANDRVPTRNFFELVGEAFLEFFAVIARIFGASWNPDTGLMNGALSDAQKADMARLGDELVDNHGAMLQTVLTQPNGRDRLRDRLVDSGRPDGATSATWEQAVDLMMVRISTRLAAHPVAPMTAAEAQGVFEYLQQNERDPAAAQLTLSTFFRERTPPVSSEARARALELIASANRVGQNRLTRLFDNNELGNRFAALPHGQQLVIVELAARHGFSASDELLSSAMLSLAGLELQADEARMLARVVSNLSEDRMGWALDREHGIPARLQALSVPERRRFLADLAVSSRSSSDLQQTLSGGGMMSVRNTRATTLSAGERRDLTQTFSAYEITLRFTDRDGHAVRVVARGAAHDTENERVITLASLLDDSRGGRALRQELGVDTADLHRLLRNLRSEVEQSHSSANAGALRELQTELRTIEGSLGANTQEDLSPWTPEARRALEERAGSVRARLLEIDRLSNLCFDVSETSSLGRAFGLYDGRTDDARAVLRRTGSGVHLSATSTVTAELQHTAGSSASLFGVTSSNYFQSTTADRNGVRGTREIHHTLRTEGGTASVQRVVEAYASLDAREGRGVRGLENGAAAGNLGQWQNLGASDVRVVTVAGTAGGALRGVPTLAARQFRESWQTAGGITTDRMTHVENPTRAELLDTLQAQIQASQRGQGVAFYYVGHMIIDRGNMEREGWMLRNGETLSPADMAPLLALAEQRGVHLMMVVDSCHGDGFVDEVRSRVRSRINDAGGDTTVEMRVSQINGGMRDLFRSWEFLNGFRDADVTRINREENLQLATNAELEPMLRAALAAPLSGNNEQALAALNAAEENLSLAQVEFDDYMAGVQAIADGNGPQRHRARASLPNLRTRAAYLERRRDAIYGLIVGISAIRSARYELMNNPSARDAYASLLASPVLLGERPIPRDRLSASREMGPVADLIAAASLIETRRALRTIAV